MCLVIYFFLFEYLQFLQVSPRCQNCAIKMYYGRSTIADLLLPDLFASKGFDN